jgi:hypothetical protein
MADQMEDLMGLILEKQNASLSDPGRFAQAIRDLAHDVHRTLKHSPSQAALRKLARRIEILSSVLGDRQGDPLKAWLDSAGREVWSVAVRQAEASCPMYLCA